MRIPRPPALTPETETSTQQFWAVPYRRDMVDACHDDLWQKQMANVLDEDHDVYIHQQRLLVNDPLAVDNDARPDGALKGDKGLYRVRPILKRLQEAEADARDYR